MTGDTVPDLAPVPDPDRAADPMPDSMSVPMPDPMPEPMPEPRPDMMPDPVGELTAVLAALRTGVAELLASVPRAPTRLRLRIGGARLELEWPEETDPVPPSRGYAPLAPDVAVVTGLPGGTVAERDDGRYESLARDLDAELDDRRNDRTGTRGSPDATVHCVCAPTVGTFYRSPAPGARPFVEVGDVVAAGQQLAVVEAMKLMVPVEADRPGRIREILPDDNAPVEYGERLFTITEFTRS